MTTRRRAALVALAMALGLVSACRDKPDQRKKAPTARADPRPAELAGFRQLVERDSVRLVEAAAELSRASEARDRDRAWRALVDFRRAYRHVEPLAKTLAPIGSSQIDPDLEEDEAPRGIGLRVLGDALMGDAPDFDAFERAVRHAASSAKLVQGELSMARFDAQRVGVSLSHAVFEWGRRLDGSEAEHADELAVDVFDGARALFEIVGPLRPDAELDASVRDLGSWIERVDGSPRDKLDALIASGRLGAAVRVRAVALGASALRPPFLPRERNFEESFREPVTLASFPALLGAPPDPDRVALGSELFFDPRLSKNGKLSCASCHAPSHALSSGATRPLGVDGDPVPRDVPGLFNAALEPMHFWDGRASTLADQVRLAVERDMGGAWSEIEERLRTDAALSERFAKAFPGGLDAGSIRLSIQEFERALTSDDTPFDRYVRGDRSAMSDELRAGFDVYFGKSRCSRCHRLPITSGTEAPRFVRSELSVIGVPTKPNAKKLDPDVGRSGVTSRKSDQHAFKVPTLRNLAATGPYFHNGAFSSLEDVVAFYEKGSGRALGFELSSFDPDARAFELTHEERRALVAFLRDGLLDPNVVAKR